jgi:Cupredoxin-like domain
MTAISQPQDARVEAEGRVLGRTYAMGVVSVGCWAVAAGLAYFLFLFGSAAVEQQRAPALLVFGSLTVLFAIVGAAAARWSGARRRGWFWMAGAILAVVVLVLNVRHIPYDLAHPAVTGPYLITILVVPGAIAAIVGGVAAFLEVRRGRASWQRSGRAGWVSVAIIGIVVGAAVTSLLAGQASAGGGGVTEVPTVTGVLTVEKIRFTDSVLRMRNGQILGLFVTNEDGIDHSFDIDSLGIHVQLPANSTTAIAIKPTGSGNLEFYCSVPGHRDAGMVGTISVD